MAAGWPGVEPTHAAPTGQAHASEEGVPTTDSSTLTPPLTNGAFAVTLIQRQVRRLGNLRADVIADRDPEPLHQLRVSLRRLRTALRQFALALELPDGVNDRRIAAVARRTGLCRDLDVLGGRLRQQLLPRLPGCEQRILNDAVKRLEQDRAQAFGTLRVALHSPHYLKLLKRLDKWQRKPRFTRLGQLPLMPWLSDWQAPFTAGLFLHPGWLEQEPTADSLHELRKRIKQARYSLEPLEPWCGPSVLSWIQDLRQAQDHLGELHDLQILNRAFVEGASFRKAAHLPALRAELEAQQRSHWLQWGELARRIQQDAYRATLQRHLLELGNDPR
jgi:CHAD domain-containing protein